MRCWIPHPQQEPQVASDANGLSDNLRNNVFIWNYWIKGWAHLIFWHILQNCVPERLYPFAVSAAVHSNAQPHTCLDCVLPLYLHSTLWMVLSECRVEGWILALRPQFPNIKSGPWNKLVFPNLSDDDHPLELLLKIQICRLRSIGLDTPGKGSGNLCVSSNLERLFNKFHVAPLIKWVL